MQAEAEKILLVHPTCEIRETIAKELEKKGYHVYAASDGLDGLFACYDHKFALILSAIDLPKVTGFEMIRTMRTHSYNNGTPIVLIGTGQESSEIVAFAAKLSAIIIPLHAITNSISKVDESTPLGDLMHWVKVKASQ